MSRARRGSNAPPVSLFAFQDVMTSVMAIILLTALMLALEQTGKGSPAPTADERAELLSRKAAAEAILDRARRTAAERPDRPLERVTEGRLTIDAVYRRIEQVEGSLKQSYDKLRGSVADPAVRERVDHVSRLEAAVAEREARLRELQLSRKLTYIAGEQYRLQPLLVELAADAWRVAATHNADYGITLSQSDRTLRLESLLALLVSSPPDRHYVLLVVKPSGLPDLVACRSSLEGEGYALGLDAIDEDWSSIIGEAAAPTEQPR